MADMPEGTTDFKKGYGSMATTSDGDEHIPGLVHSKSLDEISESLRELQQTFDTTMVKVWKRVADARVGESK